MPVGVGDDRPDSPAGRLTHVKAARADHALDRAIGGKPAAGLAPKGTLRRSMPTKNIAIIDGHPDLREGRYCHALVNAYAQSAAAAGHRIRRITLASIRIPMLHNSEEWEDGAFAADLREAADAIDWADHLVIVYPIWLGTMPALLKAFFEQVFRPGFAIRRGSGGTRGGLLNGRSARLIVTMGMPSPVFRFLYLGEGVAVMKRGILQFAGVNPIRTTLIGNVDAIGPARRRKWLGRIEKFARLAQ